MSERRVPDAPRGGIVSEPLVYFEYVYRLPDGRKYVARGYATDEAALQQLAVVRNDGATIVSTRRVT